MSTPSGPMETGPSAGAGPGGPEPDDDDLGAEAEEAWGTVGDTGVLRTGMGSAGPGERTTAELDADATPSGRTSEGRGADDQPGAAADDQT